MARDVSRHLRRLARLEATFGHRDCTCVDYPEVLAVHAKHRAEAEIEREISERQGRCPVHGPVGLVVILRTFGWAPELRVRRLPLTVVRAPRV